MKYLRLDLLTLLISLFIFSSCQKSENISLNAGSANLINSQLVDTSTVLTTSVQDDSVNTSGLSQHPFGYLADPLFGKTEANLAFTLTPPSDNLSFGTNPTLDSAVLVLKYGDELYGDSLNSSYTVNVHQLAEKFNTDIFYSNRKEWAPGSLIGSRTVKSFAWRDTIQVRQIVDGAPDTLKKIVPHLRIPIDPGFINTNFINGSSANFASTTAFRNFIKGMYLTINKEQSTGNGGIIFFDLATAGVSRLELYYKNTGSDNLKDTNMVAFSISQNTAASNIKHDYTGTVVKSKLNQVSDVIYVQGLAGLRTKLSFPFLKKLENSGNIAINKAELVVSVVDGTDAPPLPPASRLVLYRTDIAGQRQVIPDYSPSVIGAVYDKSKKRYIFNISTYIQNVLNNKLEAYDLYIAPIDYSAGTSSPNISPSATTAMRSVLGGKDNSSYKIKLNVYYTKPE